ncbi:hypothetical protein [Stutzerimonas nitrititolerans]|uniref:hypothetical protein n=1 Tax=Stutzerimonas nitrititolerans TaxID=2482751 RepID=UPI0028ABF2C3|nr:hypothetical protein [Stutzerimonas nitrititolerans]
MSQYDYGTIDPNAKSGTQLAVDLNNWRDALHSGHRGAERPLYAQAGMLWVRETSAEQWDLMLYDGDTDFVLRSVNPATNQLIKIPQDALEISLGTAATKNAQISPTDTSAGALMEVGAFGLGGRNYVTNASVDALESGFYIQQRRTDGGATPSVLTVDDYGVVLKNNYVVGPAGVLSSALVYGTDSQSLWWLSSLGTSLEDVTLEIFHRGNISSFAQTLLDDADAATARATLGALGSADVDFTIIYPNGGSEASPANAAVNSRYVTPNPFPGHCVICVPELLVDGKWGDPKWVYMGNGVSTGVRVSQLDDDSIVTQTAITVLMPTLSREGGDPFGRTAGAGNITTAPLRVKVWKVKGAIA